MRQEITIGFNIYYWGVQEQGRLIRECLFPLCRRLCSDTCVRRLWYDRNNLRGPHLFLLFTTRRRGSALLGAQILTGVTKYIEYRPSTHYLTGEQLRLLHDDGGGKALCDCDCEDGFSPNNSIRHFIQSAPNRRYPFSLFQGHNRDAFLSISKNLCLLTMEQLKYATAKWTDMLGLQFLITCDLILFDCREQARQYWMFHATTILLHLNTGKLSSEVITKLLQQCVPECSLLRSRECRDRILQFLRGNLSSTNETQIPILKAAPIIKALRAEASKMDARDYRIIRELVHVFLKQLGVATVRQIPLIFLLIASNWSESIPYVGLTDESRSSKVV